MEPTGISTKQVQISTANIGLRIRELSHLHTESKQLLSRINLSTGTYTGLSKKMDGIWNPYNLKSIGRIYTFGVLKCSEKFKVLDLP